MKKRLIDFALIVLVGVFTVYFSVWLAAIVRQETGEWWRHQDPIRILAISCIPFPFVIVYGSIVGCYLFKLWKTETG